MKKALAEHPESESFYKNIYENILDAVLLTGLDGRIFHANAAACELFGYSEEDIINKSRADMVDVHDPRLPILLEERTQNGKAKGELNWIKKDGTKFPGAVSSSVFKLKNGETRTCIVIQDLSEIHKVENALIKSKESFRSYFDNGPVAMCVNSPDNRWLEINQEFCQLLGYEKSELMSMNWLQITHPDDVEANQKLIEQLQRGQLKHFKLDKRYIRKDDSIVYATLSVVSSNSFEGRDGYSIISVIDNTEHYKALETLKNERQQLRTLVDNLPFPIYFIDKEGRKVIANKADLENIGITEENEALGKTDEQLFPGEVGVRGHADNLKVLHSGDPIVNREEYFINAKGERLWFQTTKIPLVDSEGTISGLVGIGLDVTQQRMLQQRIKESEAYYRTLVDVSPDGIIVTDTLGIVNFVSTKIFDIFGIPTSYPLVGDTIFNWIAIEHLDFAKMSFGNVLNNSIVSPSQELKCRKYDGTPFWGESGSTLLEDPNGQIKGTMIVFRDITDRKRAEEEMLKAKAKAEQSDRLKSAFLQNISHEIRTPMNSILGFLEILEDPSFSRSEKKLYATIVKKSGNRLLNTINDIVEISKIMTSNVELHLTVLDVPNFLQNRYDELQPMMEEKGLTFTLDVQTPSPLHQKTDEHKLDVVLNKVLDNAIKFTNEGSVALCLKTLGKQLCIIVQDTGIGIEPEKLSSIFQPFYQTDHDFNRKHEGAGLGLTIAKAYIEMLGGSIEIESNPDFGSTVQILLPME